MTFAEIRDAVNAAFRDHVILGIPATGANEPVKQEVREALMKAIIAIEDGGFIEPPNWAADLAEVQSRLEQVDANVSESLALFGSLDAVQAAAGQAVNALEEIRDLAANAPDAPSVANKVDRDGSNVEADAFRRAIGAASDTFQQSGPSDARTTDGKIREIETNLLDFIPPSQHGAIYAGASTYDAAAALSRAAEKGVPVRLPAGTVQAGAVVLSVPLIGKSREKSKLRCGTITIGANGVEVSHLAIISTSATTLTAANKSDLTLRDVSVSYDAGAGPARLAGDLFNISRLLVEGCAFTAGGLQLSGCDSFNISNNRWDCGYANISEPVHASAKSHGIINANTFNEVNTDAIDLYSSGRRCVVSNNRIIGCRGASGIECKVTMSDDPGNTSGATLGFFESTVITGNVLRDFTATTTGTRAGIYAEYVDNRAAPAFSLAESSRAIIITNNVLEDFNVFDKSPLLLNYYAIQYTGHNGIIANNVIRHVRTHNIGLRTVGIKLSAPAGAKCVGLSVTGNVLVGIENDTGIEHGNLEQCNISGNIIRKDEPNNVSTKYGIRLTPGASVSCCNYIGNIFDLDAANGFGMLGTATGIFSRCNVIGNQFKNCGFWVPPAEFMTFANNQCDFAVNSQLFTIGTGGTTRRGNKILGNDFLLSDDYALSLTDQSGFIISNNTFTDANRPVLLVSVSQHGIVSENVSYSQMQAAPIISYSGVSAPDQATISDTGNKII